MNELSANDLDSDEVFQKVLSEQATGSSPVDMVVSNAAQGWAGFAERPGVLASYKSPELGRAAELRVAAPQRVRHVAWTRS